MWTILCHSPKRAYTKELKKQVSKVLVAIKRSPENQAWEDSENFLIRLLGRTFSQVSEEQLVLCKRVRKD